jgi:hypothetical protein
MRVQLDIQFAPTPEGTSVGRVGRQPFGRPQESAGVWRMRRITAMRSCRDTPMVSTASSPERLRTGPSHASPVTTKPVASFQAMKGTSERPLSLVRSVRIELCEDDEIAIGRENPPRRHDRVAPAYHFQAPF